MAGPLAARLFTYPISIACSLLTAGILIQGASVEDYAGYTLVASLLPLLAFLDLGFGGAVTNWAAEYSDSGDRSAGDGTRSRRPARLKLRSRLAHSLRVTTIPMMLCVFLALAGLIWAVAGNLSWLDMPGGILMLALAVYCVTIPFSILSKMLVGTGRTSTWIFIQLIQPVTALVVVATVVALHSASLAPVTPSIALLAMCFLGAIYGVRSVRLPFSLELYRHPEAAHREEKLFSAAWPMMIILVANPLALSTDRLILSQVATTDDVASYSLAAQMFSPALALLSATGLSLWPIFAKRRFRGEATRPWAMTASFGAVALVVSGGLYLISPWFVSLVAGDKIELTTSLILCLSAAFVVQAIQLPLGMSMMQGRALKVQAFLLVLMFASKFALSFAFIPILGSGGPALATAISILVCQVIPGAWLLLRKTV
ncbi:putative integral membrane protein [Paenarthrobacter aurescens TC1]|uniref:Integral membrane protein n=1 Tax=Paenarthrobacter aurescens (strain TC1) TaxID=290340 RepID=A1R9F3_PAEAT|nr:putative integral membrane protein [Paenarthrobacter aurescens TC1]